MQYFPIFPAPIAATQISVERCPFYACFPFFHPQNISILVVLLYSWRISVNVKKYSDLEDVYYGIAISGFFFSIFSTVLVGLLVASNCKKSNFQTWTVGTEFVFVWNLKKIQFSFFFSFPDIWTCLKECKLRTLQSLGRSARWFCSAWCWYSASTRLDLFSFFYY